jgi:hypothetical protein
MSDIDVFANSGRIIGILVFDDVTHMIDIEFDNSNRVTDIGV